MMIMALTSFKSTFSLKRNLSDKILLMWVIFSLFSMATNGVKTVLFSTETVGIPGDTFHFICSNPSRTALSVQWLVNGTLLENSRLEVRRQRFNRRSKTANLFFDLPLEYNVTTIQCIGNFASENVSSNSITLLLQGLLSTVGSPSVDLADTNISLTWTAPFTLDISNADPDITYCLDVINSTSSSRVLSECGITLTNFSIPLGRVCDNLNFSFTVTPVNRVGIGTAVTLEYFQDITAPRAREELLLPISEFTYLITMSAPVCYVELTVINDNTEDETHIQGSDLNITKSTITFTSENVLMNQLYTVSVNASNINGSAVSYISLSTHDVMNATFDVTSRTIATEYFEYSTAMGALYIFIFINENRSIDFKKSIYLPLDRSSSHNYTLPDISPGQYQISVYDIESGGKLHDGVGYSASRDQFTIAGNNQGSYGQMISSREIEDCSVTYVDDVISAMCSYSGGSSVTGFQIIVQLNNVTEVHKLHINGTTEHLSPGPVTVQVEENGTYQIAIFPIMSNRGIINTTIAYSRVLPDTEPQTMIPETSKDSSQELTTVPQTMIPETSKESSQELTTETPKEDSQGWIAGVIVPLGLLLIIIVIVARIGIGYKCNHSAEADIPAATKPKQEDQAYRQENTEFRDSEYSISEVQTLQDCGSSIPFMSQYGLPQDTSSGDVWMSNSEVGCAYSVNVALAENNISWSDQKEVDNSQCSILNECAAIHEKAVQNQLANKNIASSLPADVENFPSSLKRESTDQKILSPKGELTDQEMLSPKGESTEKNIVPTSHKNRLIDRRAMILLMLVLLFRASTATNSVHLFSLKTVSTPGDEYGFHCLDTSHTALSVQWLVNGTPLENSTLEIVFQHFDNITKTADLSFKLHLEDNGTTIQCIIDFPTKYLPSETITLLLQGKLPAVGSPSVDLVDTDISLTWTAPFTLDISNVDPDITYCVDVVNSTSSSRVLSECGITVTGFNFSIPVGRVCDNYTFTVIPVNVVGNGTAVTLGYSQDITYPRAREELLLPTSESTYQITMSAPVCYGELTVINDYTGDETRMQGSDLNITMNIIMFTSKKLKDNQLYTVSVNASNINSSAVSSISLSTHDVMNTTFDVTSHTITTEYFEYSTAMGALYIFIFINEDRFIDFKKSIYLPLDKSSSHNYTLSDISPGQYQISVYDIESSGKLHDGVGYSASRDQSTIARNSQGSFDQVISSREIEDCSVTYMDDVISAMCSYTDSSSVTGFQMIVQSNNVDKVHKLYVNGTTEYLSPGPVTVRVEENGTHQVAIFPIMSNRGIMNTTIAYSRVLPDTEPQISETSEERWIAGVVVALVVLIIIIGIGIGYIYYKKCYLKMFPVNEKYNVKGHADSPINNGPTITGLSSSPITMMTMMPISIESITGTPDSGIFISSTDSIFQSIPPSVASAQSTESEDNPGGKESKPGHDTVNQAWKNQQEVDNDVQSMDCNTGKSMEKKNKKVNSQQALKPITEGTIGFNTEGAMGSNTISPMGTNTKDSVGFNTVSPMGSNTKGAVSTNTEEAVDTNTEDAMDTKTQDVVGFNTVNPDTKDAVGSNTVSPVSYNTEDAVGSVSLNPVGSNTDPNPLSTLSTISTQSTEDLNYTYVQPKSANTAIELSRSVNRTTYATVLPHLTQPKGPAAVNSNPPAITPKQKQKIPETLDEIQHDLGAECEQVPSVDHFKPTATEPKQEDQVYRPNLGEIAGFRDLEGSISTVQTLQDCGSSVPFMSQYGLSKDLSSSMTTTKTCSTGNILVTGVHDVKSSHISLKPATIIFSDSYVKLVYVESEFSPDTTCSINGDVWKSNSGMSYTNSVDVALAENNISWSEVQKDQKIVDNSQSINLNECAAIHEKAVQNQLANKKIAPSLLANGKKFLSSTKREPTDQEIPSPKREFTGKNIVPTSHKNGLIEWRAMILLMLIVLFRASTATNSVHLFSLKTVSTPGDECGFHCLDTSLTALSVQWLVNGTPLENSTLEIVFQHFDNITKTADLSFNLHLEDNGTIIQCIINFPTKNVPSETITLLLQGTLPAVGSPSVDLVDTDISLTWTAPFTLDIPNVDPDITYCVDVINSASSSRVLSECGITVTGFNFSIPIGRVCDNYTFTVTPVNVVGNGTAVTLGHSQDNTFTDVSSTTSSSQNVAVLTVQVTGMLLANMVMVNAVTGDENSPIRQKLYF